MPLCHLALGSNLGERLAHLRAAVAALAGQGLPPRLLSSVYETSPLDAPGAQMKYLNAVVAVEAALAPRALVAACLVVEAALGRQERRHQARCRLRCFEGRHVQPGSVDRA